MEIHPQKPQLQAQVSTSPAVHLDVLQYRNPRPLRLQC